MATRLGARAHRMGGFVVGRCGGNPCRVLVIEDDQATRHFLVSVLDDAGYEARWAGNGKDAIDSLPAWPPDLILLDLMMPVMDGWAFRARQRDLDAFAATPTIIVSGNERPSAADLGSAVFVHKPFELAELLKAIDHALL